MQVDLSQIYAVTYPTDMGISGLIFFFKQGKTSMDKTIMLNTSADMHWKIWIMNCYT